MSGVCARTGLAYVTGPVTGFRIAKTSYGPLNPLARPAGVAERSSWSRFDTTGSTIYLAADAATAYAETLAMARMSRKYRSAITFAAEFYGISWDAALDMVRDEWTAHSNENSVMSSSASAESRRSPWVRSQVRIVRPPR